MSLPFNLKIPHSIDILGIFFYLRYLSHHPFSPLLQITTTLSSFRNRFKNEAQKAVESAYELPTEDTEGTRDLIADLLDKANFRFLDHTKVVQMLQST